MNRLNARQWDVLRRLRDAGSISVEVVSSGPPWPGATLRALARRGLATFRACCTRCDHAECRRWLLTDDGHDAARRFPREEGTR